MQINSLFVTVKFDPSKVNNFNDDVWKKILPTQLDEEGIFSEKPIVISKK